jgi:hypothetical protein
MATSTRNFKRALRLLQLLEIEPSSWQFIEAYFKLQ